MRVRFGASEAETFGRRTEVARPADTARGLQILNASYRSIAAERERGATHGRAAVHTVGEPMGAYGLAKAFRGKRAVRTRHTRTRRRASGDRAK